MADAKEDSKQEKNGDNDSDIDNLDFTNFKGIYFGDNT